MRFTPQPSQQYLRECFDYDEATGLLAWRARPRHHFDCDNKCARWAGRWAGVPAFRERDSDGYLGGRLDRQRRKAHRIIWKLFHGVEPVEIDHIDRDPANNRIENLRSVDHTENARNRGAQSNNTSGCPGVVWSRGRWVARIKIAGSHRHLGNFREFEDAVAARKAGEIKHGFRQSSGVEFA